jgi:putative transcriptional regulator
MLRDLRESTKLLILLEIVNNRPKTLNSISSKLGITVQGTSDYIRTMTAEGFVKKIGGEYRATKKGVDLLQERMLKLKDFVDSSMKQLEIVDVCGAIAGNEVKKDDEVGLFMEDGLLVAYSDKSSPSIGYAVSDAKKGEDLAVRDLSGMVALKPGRITVLQVPSLQEGGTRSVSIKKARKTLKGLDFDKVAVMDVVSRAFANTLKIGVDFDFAPLSSSFEAALRGIDVLIIASRENVPVVVSELETENGKLEDPVPYEVKSLI